VQRGGSCSLIPMETSRRLASGAHGIHPVKKRADPCEDERSDHNGEREGPLCVSLGSRAASGPGTIDQYFTAKQAAAPAHGKQSPHRIPPIMSAAAARPVTTTVHMGCC
jgi:hypothetical protein